MPRTVIDGSEQIRDESVTGDDTLDGSLGRSEMDITTVGNSQITQGTTDPNNMTHTETGADSGTGSVVFRSRRFVKQVFSWNGVIPASIDHQWLRPDSDMTLLERGILSDFVGNSNGPLLQHALLWTDVAAPANQWQIQFWVNPSLGVPATHPSLLPFPLLSFIGLVVNVGQTWPVQEVGITISRVTAVGASPFTKGRLTLWYELA